MASLNWKELPWRRFIKFGIIGGSALVIDIAIYYLLTRTWQVPYLLSRSVSLTVALFWNFTLNRNWTFRAMTGKVGHQAVRFLTVMAVTSLLSLFLMRVGVSTLGLPDLLVLLTVSVLITLINFFSHSRWSYKS